MNDFKPGDRVEYVGETSEKMIGKVGVVVEPPFINAGLVYFDHGGAEPFGAYGTNLRHVTPDVLTIPRAELPEVVESGNLFGEAGGSKFDMVNATEGWWRTRALEALAIAEFLAAREKAEQDAADQHAAILNKRRDELAAELAPRCDSNLPPPNWYENVSNNLQRAIDRIIQLESAVKK